MCFCFFGFYIDKTVSYNVIFNMHHSGEWHRTENIAALISQRVIKQTKTIAVLTRGQQEGGSVMTRIQQNLGAVLTGI